MLNTLAAAPSVSELVASIKQTLEDSFNEVFVEGELSGISQAHSGHCYFNLMDSDASVGCALFRQDLLRHPQFKNFKDGDRVRVYGRLTVYQKRGTFQIQVKHVVAVGEGLLKQRYEALKKKLTQEGLFDLEKKRPLPSFPRRIALVTAPGGAALHDFLNVYRRRAFGFEIVIIPALVQGERAPASLVAALDRAEQSGPYDVIVVTRGGGSPEDLWCFNDELLVRRLARSSAPVISAVGHEVDWTLSDLVADLRCETPTAAAERLTQPQTEVARRLSGLGTRMRARLQQQRAEVRDQLARFHPRRVLGLVTENIALLREQLNRLNPVPRAHLYLPLAEKSYYLDELTRRLAQGLEARQRLLAQRLDTAQARLHALGPREVLRRGYGIVKSRDHVVASAKDWASLQKGTAVALEFYDGHGEAQKL